MVNLLQNKWRLVKLRITVLLRQNADKHFSVGDFFKYMDFEGKLVSRFSVQAFAADVSKLDAIPPSSNTGRCWQE